MKRVLDALAACAAMLLASAILGQRLPNRTGLAGFVALAMAVNLGLRFGSQHYRMVGIEEARSLLFGNLILVAGAMLVCALRGRGWPGQEPREVILGACLLTGPMWLALRMVCSALHRRRRQAPSAAALSASPARRTLIVGAGRAGTLICQEMLENPALRNEVLGFVDDAMEKQGVRIHGIPVLGPTELLPLYIREQRAAQVILSMPRVPGSRLRELTDLARSAGADVKTVPGIADLVGDRPWKPEVRDIAIEDLLRREPILLDCAPVRAAVKDSVVLITGGGGSIGSELARRVAELRPAAIVLLGRGENSLWLAQRDLAQRYPRQALAVALCDIRNPERLQQVFQAWKPEVVLHAAAHKHVPFLEENPEEAIENNIFGTRNVVDAALDWGTRILVNVSTDKAVDPVSVLGASKRIGELIVAKEAARAKAGQRLVSVRFGNVLGSRGSVIPIFKEQIRKGGPVTVTHPEMARYFMTIPEAAQLVLQAGLLGDGGKVFALDMGDPVRIVDLAREMVRLSGFTPGGDIDIQFTGIRPGEKLSEELFTSGEERRTWIHPKILESVQDPLDPALLERGLRTLQSVIVYPGQERQAEILGGLMALVPNYRPSPAGLGRLLPGDQTAKPRPAGDPEERPLFPAIPAAPEGGLSFIA
ncbi:MAG: nucleoside-diphosphate sugar epimerase/dehydratase [Holophaga sp.]|nr:nucleoside-diphosphate sugar epimerase/dehydratase [Holophaga sp.]